MSSLTTLPAACTGSQVSTGSQLTNAPSGIARAADDPAAQRTIAPSHRDAASWASRLLPTPRFPNTSTPADALDFPIALAITANSSARPISGQPRSSTTVFSVVGPPFADYRTDPKH